VIYSEHFRPGLRDIKFKSSNSRGLKCLVNISKIHEEVYRAIVVFKNIITFKSV